MKPKPAGKIVRVRKRLSLAPLSFDEAITDVLKIRPKPKPHKSKTPVSKKPTGDAKSGR